MFELALIPLKYPQVYIKIQSIIGANRLREKCINIIKPKPGDIILDIGCGPAQILESLPKVKKYYGFYTEKQYIDYAAKKYAGRGEFFSCEFNGKFVRQREGYYSLIDCLFKEKEIKILNNTCKIPSTEIIMHLAKPY